MNWQLIEVIDYENNAFDLDERGPPTITSEAWFSPHNRSELEHGRALVKALRVCWEKTMRKIPGGAEWTTNLQIYFGRKITPQEASKLMVLFMWLGTNVGRSILVETFKSKNGADLKVVNLSNNYFFMKEILGNFYCNFFDERNDIRRWFETRCGMAMVQEDETLIRTLLRFVCMPHGLLIINEAHAAIGWKPLIAAEISY